MADLSVIEVETYGAPPATIEKLRKMKSVVSVSVDEIDQRQMLMVQTPRGAEAVPELMDQLKDIRVGRVVVREPSLEDAYVRLVGGKT